MKKETQTEKDYVYLDWAAATPLLPEAFSAMEPFLKNQFGNPGAVHAKGAVAKNAVGDARDEVARAIQVRPEFVTFTGGGTEANNLAIFGLLRMLHESGRSFSEMEVITTKMEHPSVSRALEHLKQYGLAIKYVGVTSEGKIDFSELKDLINEKTVLVSCSYVNSEIGVIQSLHGIKKIIFKAQEKFNTNIYLHVDAAQAPLWLTCKFDTVEADLLTLDAGKCCGPKGVGVLVQSKRVKISPVTFGGGQEEGLRPGTENVAGIVGAGAAFAFAQAEQKKRAEKVSLIRDEGIEYILNQIPEAILNGPVGDERVANNINISIPGLDTEFATVVLDSKGFAVSTKSACSGAGGGESVVVKAISDDPARALSTLRITLGPDSTFEQIKNTTDILSEHQIKIKNLTQ